MPRRIYEIRTFLKNAYGPEVKREIGTVDFDPHTILDRIERDRGFKFMKRHELPDIIQREKTELELAGYIEFFEHPNPTQLRIKRISAALINNRTMSYKELANILQVHEEELRQRETELANKWLHTPKKRQG